MDTAVVKTPVAKQKAMAQPKKAKAKAKAKQALKRAASPSKIESRESRVAAIGAKIATLPF